MVQQLLLLVFCFFLQWFLSFYLVTTFWFRFFLHWWYRKIIGIASRKFRVCICDQRIRIEWISLRWSKFFMGLGFGLFFDFITFLIKKFAFGTTLIFRFVTFHGLDAFVSTVGNIGRNLIFGGFHEMRDFFFIFRFGFFGLVLRSIFFVKRRLEFPYGLEIIDNLLMWDSIKLEVIVLILYTCLVDVNINKLAETYLIKIHRDMFLPPFSILMFGFFNALDEFGNNLIPLLERMRS